MDWVERIVPALGDLSTRTWRCVEPACAVKVFTEQNDQLAAPRAKLSTRACWWALSQLRGENASILGLARQLGTTWNTVWSDQRRKWQ